MPRLFTRLAAKVASLPPIAVAMGASALLHGIVLSIHFVPPPPKPEQARHALEVVLVNAKSTTRPSKPQALAQANLDGGGNTEQKLRASSPLPALGTHDPQPELRQRAQRVEELEQEAARLMAQVRATTPRPAPAPTPAPVAPTVPVQGSDLISQSLELARLQAQIEKDYQQYQARPKRRFVGARTEEYRFAQYVEDWRLKVERIGNLNYPEEARRKKIYGSLLLTVHIRSDGSVEKIDVDRSSGSPILDEAAVRIVKLAAPFAPFPENIRKDTDILAITRTWTFTREDQLTSQ
ncbi:energy transducer TonB [Thiobacter aerophilum]|uniref:Energy transducer TonB n=1 Tax=Thiobacter aerophilum TaxID=3121275 RepID=A0ABV0EF19_9BURK